MLRLTHVTLKTRQVILQDADFTFKKGRVYGLLAINGSGKTTLFRAMSKLLPLSSGHIAVPPSLFYYESVEWLDGNLSGMDYLRLIKNIWKSDLNLRDEIAYWEMADYISLPIRKYSLGMKQRLVIA
ncbi:TPA: ATP-binding cassette domain-containing protein, partial [Streptococcus pneumoniae]|nr:ATP-binding cassette domain-containing protein [Streptococcus pneumoniae]